MKKQKGFTIVELLTVLVIIGILVAGWGIKFNKIKSNSRDTLRKQQKLIVQQSLNDFYKTFKKYPQTLIELKKEGFISENPSFLFKEKKDFNGGIYDIE